VHGDLGEAKLAVDWVALEPCPLNLASDGHGGIAVEDGAGLLKAHLGGDQLFLPVAVKPLLLVQDEACGADEPEVRRGERPQGVGVASCLGLRPSPLQLTERVGRLWHRCLLEFVVGAANDRGRRLRHQIL
jgi:hypothetical protein